MTIHGVTGRGYLLRPFFIGYARGFWNEIEGAQCPESLPFMGWAKILNFKREGVTL